ncbi:hypothetical protein AVEN_263219-1 [Araneus ventricosus]|uniref:Uncharacterized protein n=1 Tax=Araneus ventricosus TaxID=182803 RepID=A0A4Y2FEJ7_ARAVE|nr:hypothetical protein AVEN_263219-1 [Araneus ventricosus]
MKWQKRQRRGEQVIGRMPVVNLQDSERNYLLILLLRKLETVSFDDLKTVDGIVCNTFQQASKMQGLLEGVQHCTNMPEELKGRPILAVTNDASIDLNNQVLACLPGGMVVSEAADDIISADPNDRLTFELIIDTKNATI